MKHNVKITLMRILFSGDPIVAGVIAGVSGILVMNLLTYSFWAWKKTEWLYAHLDASYLLHWFRTKQPLSVLLGQIINTTIGGAIGVLFHFLLIITGTQFYRFKGICTGILSWLILYVLPSSRGKFSIRSYDPKIHLITFISSIIYGLATSLTAKKLREWKGKFAVGKEISYCSHELE